MDLIYVTYNSEQWIEQCFEALTKVNYNKKNLSVFAIDNNSSDSTIEKLKKIQATCTNIFGDFHIIQKEENLGFGCANNEAFYKGTSDIVCFLNIDTELHPDALTHMDEAIQNSSEKTVAWEFRQFPYEHPKVYNPCNLETTWFSGAAFAVRRTTFAGVNGFDEHIFMYAEDVDLSWRIRSFGYRLQYVPKSVIYHYSYQQKTEVKPTQYRNSINNNILLRYRFGTCVDVLKGYFQLLCQLIYTSPYQGAKRELFAQCRKSFKLIPFFRDKTKLGDSPNFKPNFVGSDYTLNRDGAFYQNHLPSTDKKVSVLVRTCGRPDVLRKTLQSLRCQTYPNLEIVVVEDGEPTSKGMIETEFHDLNVLYHATCTKVGRSKAGNIAMQLAHGRYLNFLDDDDLLYADHVEVLVSALEKSTNKAAYAFAFETPIIVESKSPYNYTITGYRKVHRQAFDKVMLCHHNYIPIQCIMFEKALFLQYGGLDETLDALEDWDLWVRFSLHTDFSCVEKTTSIYRVPANQEINSDRQKILDETLKTVREKHKKYQQTISVYDLAILYAGQKRVWEKGEKK